VTNNGAIVMGSSNGGILAGSDTRIVNTGTIVLGSGFGIQSAGERNSVVNSGSITIAAGGTGLNVGGNFSPTSNSGAIKVLSATATAFSPAVPAAW